MAVANTVIQLKKSGISGNIPASLNVGETALNYADGKLFYKNSLGSISYIASASSFATVNANSSLILATSPTDILSFTGSNGIVITGNTTSKTINIDSLNDLTLANTANTTANAAYYLANSANVLAQTAYVLASAGSTDYTARALANSKTQTYSQDTAPTSPNANDLWLANTGVMYENFGNTTYPIWAETGPTNITYTQGGGISASGYLNNSVIFANATGYLSNTTNIQFYTSNNNLYVAGTLNVSNISANVITSNTITANVITSNTITANSITSNTITANIITSNTITANSITSNTITANSITSNTITANTITSNTITANVITSNGAVNGSQLVATNGLIINNQTISSNVVIPAGYSSLMVGPMTIANGANVALSNGSRLIII